MSISKELVVPKGGFAAGITNKRRWVLIVVVFTNFVVWSDQGKFALLTPFWSQDLGFNTEEIGSISSAYLLGYFPLLFLAGFFSDRLGSKPILITCLTGVTVLGISMIYVVDYGEMWWRNLAFGVFFGLLWAPCQRMLSVWFPAIDLPRVTAIWVAGQLGSGLIEPLYALPLADAFGWRPAFVVVSLIGIPALLGLIFLTTSNPRRMRGISEHEINLIEENRPATEDRIPMREIGRALKRRNVLLLVLVAATATTPGWMTSTWGTVATIQVGGADPNVVAWVGPLLAAPGVIYTFFHGRVVNKVFKGSLKWPMFWALVMSIAAFLAAAIFVDWNWFFWSLATSPLLILANALLWGSTNPMFVREARPEAVGTLNGIGAGFEVAVGYVLVSLSGTWINMALGGFAPFSLMLFIGVGVFVFALICVLFMKERPEDRVTTHRSPSAVEDPRAVDANPGVASVL